MVLKSVSIITFGGSAAMELPTLDNRQRNAVQIMEGIVIRNFLLKWPAAKNAILRQENCVATVDQCPNCFFLGEPADPFRRLHVSTLFRLRHASFDSARYGVFRNSGQPILRTFEDAVRTDEEEGRGGFRDESKQKTWM